MPISEVHGVHHLRLTVTDIDRSRAFYATVLGFEVVAESPGGPGDPDIRTNPDALYGGVVFNANGTILGLRPVADPADRFDSERVGLDHVSFQVPSFTDLEAAASRLAEASVEHGDIKRLPSFGIAILSFSDPDGIHLELTAPL
jgi:catechol 2,3-dioxygenase-like lactoylglutathione lyase family enzyme